jgi:hypothetical protein
MTSSTLKIAAALPTKPIFEVFSRKCGVSAMKDAGIATVNLLLDTSLFLLQFGDLLTCVHFLKP